jgi:hypothetical protein
MAPVEPRGGGFRSRNLTAVDEVRQEGLSLPPRLSDMRAVIGRGDTLPSSVRTWSLWGSGRNSH